MLVYETNIIKDFFKKKLLEEGCGRLNAIL